MENNHFMGSNELKVQKDRPTFLTVLCVFTFIISGFWFLSSLFGVLTYDALVAEEAMETSIVAVQEAMAAQPASPMTDLMTNSMAQMAQEQLEYHSIINWSTVLSTLISLIGGFLMFRMKKNGFHVYVVSKLVGLVPLTVLTFNFMVGATYIIMGVFTLAFIIMYAVNLKHMKQ